MIIPSINFKVLPDGARQYLIHSINKQASVNGFSSRILAGINMVLLCFVNPGHFQNKNERITKRNSASKTIEFLDKWFNTPRHSRIALSEKLHLPAGFDVTETVNYENQKLSENHKVTGTPTIYVNGSKISCTLQLLYKYYDKIHDIRNISSFSD